MTNEPSSDDRMSLRDWLFRAPKVVWGLVLAPFVAFAVNYYAPGLFESTSRVVRNNDRILASAEYDEGIYDDGWIVALESDFSSDTQPPGQPNCSDVRAWLVERGAVDAGTTYLQVAIEGDSTDPVVIKQIHARVVSRNEPITNTSVGCPSAGAFDVIGIGFDLDEQDPAAKALKKDGTFGGPYFSRKAISLAKNESQVLAVTATTEDCYCQWVLDIAYLVEGQRQVLTVDAGDGPFATTAIAKRYERTYEWAWHRDPAKFVRLDDFQDEPPPNSMTSEASGSDSQRKRQRVAIAQLPTGLFCRDLHGRGYSYSQAVYYWQQEGRPDRMDASGTGRPCTTVYPNAEVASYWGQDPVTNLSTGLYCRDLRAGGYSYAQAVEYWLIEGRPARMDAVGRGRPCTTVYPDVEVDAYWSRQ